MHRTSFAVLLAFAAGTAVAQVAVPARPDSADASRPVPAFPYRSAFKDYRPDTDPEPVRWREANDEMGRLNGHIGHVPGSVPPRGASATSKPPAHAGHGASK